MLTVFRAISNTKKCVANTFSENHPKNNAIFRVPHICIVVNCFIPAHDWSSLLLLALKSALLMKRSDFSADNWQL